MSFGEFLKSLGGPILGVFIMATVAVFTVSLVNRRRHFRSEIFKYLPLATINYSEYGRLYPEIVSINIYNSIFAFQISVSFRLTSQSLHQDLESLAFPKQIQTRVYEVTLAPGEETGGEQVLFYTFNSSDGIEKSMHDFEGFCSEQYLSPGKICESYRSWWERIQYSGESRERPEG
jgi:hypothetical protein